MKKQWPLKRHVVAVTLIYFLISHLAFSQFGQATDSDTALRNIRKHLSRRSELTYNEPLLFVGIIDALGPVCSMCVCKGAIEQHVAFRIENVVWGESRGEEAQLHTGYINCTMQSLPAPPFALQGRVIVYCEQVPHVKCLAPVVFTQQRLATVQKWLAGLDSK